MSPAAAPTAPRVRHRNWVLTGEALDRLLAAFDPDRTLAALRYEETRARIASFFRWRHATDPDECADRTLDRVARTLEQGRTLQIESGFQYFYAVALNLWLEKLRDASTRTESLENVPEPIVEPGLEREEQLRKRREEHRIAWLESCLDRLPEGSRGILLRYHTAESGRIAIRKRLAAALGISQNALRIRACRIRASLEESSRAYIEGQG